MIVEIEILHPFVQRSKESEDYMLKIIEMSLKYKVFKECFRVIYNRMIPIEDLPKEEKQDLWDYVKQKFPNRKQNEKIQLCKSVYVMGSLF